MFWNWDLWRSSILFFITIGPYIMWNYYESWLNNVHFVRISKGRLNFKIDNWPSKVKRMTWYSFVQECTDALLVLHTGITLSVSGMRQTAVDWLQYIQTALTLGHHTFGLRRRMNMHSTTSGNLPNCQLTFSIGNPIDFK